MCDNDKECKHRLNELKSCLNEMPLPVLDPTIENGSGKITTGFNIFDVSVYVEIEYRSYNEEAEIRIDSSLSMDDLDPFITLQILNIINAEMMDIGHICFDPYCEMVLMHASIDFTKPGFVRAQMLARLKRFIHQVYLCFKILRRISQTSECPFKVLSDHFNAVRCHE